MQMLNTFRFKLECAEAIVLNQLQDILATQGKGVEVFSGFGGENMASRDLVFTGRVYFYSERPVPERCKRGC